MERRICLNSRGLVGDSMLGAPCPAFASEHPFDRECVFARRIASMAATRSRRGYGLNLIQSRGGAQGGGVASEHSPVLVSTFAPAALSSSGAAASEAQPDANQATAIKVTVSLMGCSPELDKRSIRNHASFFSPDHGPVSEFDICVTPETWAPSFDPDRSLATTRGRTNPLG
jgi:hypothetical protein